MSESSMTPVADITGAPVLEGEHGYSSFNERIAALPLTRFGYGWLAGVGIAASIALAGAAAAAWLLYRGVGVWGVNIPVAWGFAIANFVWWIGIGHAGTLISAILLLLRQPWRNSINRFAEAMTIFAVLNAGMFPLLHLGRYWKFYYLLPYPNQMTVWPQWRSPLVWDAFAVATYATVSVLFWYLGLIPDLGALRDRARSGGVRRLAAIGALGWRGEARQWASLRRGYLVLAGLATALVVSVHSIVSLDFAVSIVPGWNATIFPPYFVAGAIFSGMAMVLTLSIPLRALLRMRDLVTVRHLDLMAKVMLTTGLMVGYGYLMEVFTEWLSTEPSEQYRLHARLAGHGAAAFWGTVVCNVVVAQLLWFRRVRTAPMLLFVVSLVINVGMWLERFDIVVTSLERDYMPSAWRAYVPTLIDWAVLIGTLGLFCLLFLLFVRLLPISPVYELKELAHEHGRVLEEPRARPAGAPAPPVGLGEAPTTLIAEYSDAGPILAAARRLAASGHELSAAYTPMPVEGLDETLRRRAPGYIAPTMLLGGLAGGIGGYLLQFLSAAIDYPWEVGGKPRHPWPSFVPITYELTILGASLAGVAVVLFACRLPRLHHPVFDLPGFDGVTRDRFLLAVRSPADRARALAVWNALSETRPLCVHSTQEEVG
jgi:molybdopterin-containing oxidoreductase family membrane subunit